MEDINLKANVHNLIPGLVEKLGDNKIVIRQSAFKAFRGILLSIRHRTLISMLLNYLSNKNWHIREEILNVFILLFLTNQHQIDFDYPLLLNSIAKLLDDPKPKVSALSFK